MYSSLSKSLLGHSRIQAHKDLGQMFLFHGKRGAREDVHIQTWIMERRECRSNRAILGDMVAPGVRSGDQDVGLKCPCLEDLDRRPCSLFSSSEADRG